MVFIELITKERLPLDLSEFLRYRASHDEHKRIHLQIYRRLNNPLVVGILEADWEAYEAMGLNVYTDYKYLADVWHYHEKLISAIRTNEYDKALMDQSDMLLELLDRHPGKQQEFKG